jgi:hypothetical protein
LLVSAATGDHVQKRYNKRSLTMAVSTYINITADAGVNVKDANKIVHLVAEHTSPSGDASFGYDHAKFTTLAAIDSAWSQIRNRIVGSGLK